MIVIAKIVFFFPYVLVDAFYREKNGKRGVIFYTNL
jgi:hypothetical protein